MKSKKVNPERIALIELSNQAQVLREQILLTTGEELTINETLMLIHRETSGANTFKRFDEWKKEGFKVKAKEKAYRVWAKPRKGKVKSEESDSGNEKAEDKYKFFPMCCLFNENQVEPISNL